MVYFMIYDRYNVLRQVIIQSTLKWGDFRILVTNNQKKNIERMNTHHINNQLIFTLLFNKF